MGHWEIAGLVSPNPMRTYPDGFPEEVLKPFREKTGRGVLCNKPYSGTEVIKDYGDEHVDTGDLIVYTSADSVFQIAAHEAIVPPEQLYEYCRIARAILRKPKILILDDSTSAVDTATDAMISRWSRPERRCWTPSWTRART